MTARSRQAGITFIGWLLLLVPVPLWLLLLPVRVPSRLLMLLLPVPVPPRLLMLLLPVPVPPWLLMALPRRPPGHTVEEETVMLMT